MMANQYLHPGERRACSREVFDKRITYDMHILLLHVVECLSYKILFSELDVILELTNGVDALIFMEM